LSQVSRAERRAAQRQIKQIELLEGRLGILLYRENNGQTTVCLVDNEVEPILRIMHNDHGHFSDAITLDRFIGQAYWPYRVRDDKWLRGILPAKLGGKITVG
jgi:hypothetical protein